MKYCVHRDSKKLFIYSSFVQQRLPIKYLKVSLQHDILNGAMSISVTVQSEPLPANRKPLHVNKAQAILGGDYHLKPYKGTTLFSGVCAEKV